MYSHVTALKPVYPLFVSGQEIAKYLLRGSGKYRGAVLTLPSLSALYELATTKDQRLPFVMSCLLEAFYGCGPYLDVAVGNEALILLQSSELIAYPLEERLQREDRRYQKHFCFCYDDGTKDAQQLLWVPEFIPLEADVDSWLGWRQNISCQFQVIRINDVAPEETLIYHERSFFFDLVKQRENADYRTLEVGECIELKTPPMSDEKTDRRYVMQRVG